MAIDPNTYYRTIADYDAYFADNPWADDWKDAILANKEWAAQAATRAIDNLHFKNVKKTLYDALVADAGEDAQGKEGDILLQNTRLTTEQIRAAYNAQLKQFPRDTQAVDTVPDDIFAATCEEAIYRLAMRDPQQAFRNLTLTQGGVSSNRTSQDRNREPQRHVTHFLTSPYAMQLCGKWLSQNQTFRIQRA